MDLKVSNLVNVNPGHQKNNKQMAYFTNIL